MSKNETSSKRFMIMDACVLIDFILAAPALFKLISKHVGPLPVVSVVFEEVTQIESTQHLADLGLILIEPEIVDAFEAERLKGKTSFQDNLCYLTAKRHSLICVTNDKKLRNQCKEDNIPILWGLQLILELHKANGLPANDALEMVKQMHKNNPRHITTKILKDFKSKLSLSTL